MTPTIKSLRSQCTEVADMWLWSGRVGHTGVPRICVAGKDTSVYRVIYALHHKISLDDIGTDVIWPVTEQSDINPANLKRGTRRQLQNWRKAQGRTAHPVAAKAAMTLAARARASTKLTAEIVSQARSSTQSSRALSRQLGVSPSTITQARRGKTWREQVIPGASIFAMGGV